MCRVMLLVRIYSIRQQRSFDNEYKRVREIRVGRSRRIPLDDSWNVGNFEKGW